ncbi:MAG: AAA family ATPase [Deltaproteobacteria bacterium]|nr:AAA family ATPase [Deltaproteobacteria bacterium]
MPIVVALRAAGKDQIVHIEQPELHLHPRAEIALADLFVAAARRGARLVLRRTLHLARAFRRRSRGRTAGPTKPRPPLVRPRRLR